MISEYYDGTHDSLFKACNRSTKAVPQYGTCAGRRGLFSHVSRRVMASPISTLLVY